MYVLILNILAYAFDAVMLMFYYCRTLGRRYSVWTTALATAGWWAVQSAGKLPLLYLGKDYNMTAVMIVQCCVMAFYLFLCYGSSPAKKLLAFVLMTAALGAGEFTAVLIAGQLFDIGGGVLELGSEFTVAGLLLMRPLAVLSYYAAYQVWNLFHRSAWIRGRRQWLCVLLPVSQFFLLWHLAEVYTFEKELLPIPVLAGVFLAFAADVYMFAIFARAQERESVENGLWLKQHLRRLEQLRYEKLCSSMEESSRLRHDFRNYLLILRSMAETQKAAGIEKTGDKI